MAGKWSGLTDLFRSFAGRGARAAENAPPSPARNVDAVAANNVRPKLSDYHGDKEAFRRATDEWANGRAARHAGEAAPAAGRSVAPVTAPTVGGTGGAIASTILSRLGTKGLIIAAAYTGLVDMPFDGKDGGWAIRGAYGFLARNGVTVPTWVENNPYYQEGLADRFKQRAEARTQEVAAGFNTAWETLRSGGTEADAIFERVSQKTGIPLAHLMSSDPQTRLQAAQIFNVGNPDNETLAVRRLLAGGQEGGENMTMAKFIEDQNNAITSNANAAINEQTRALDRGIADYIQSRRGGAPASPAP